MKTLIQNSVFISKLSKGPNAITIFNRKSTADKDLIKYIDVSTASGKTVEVYYSYDEDGTVKQDSIFVEVPSGKTELQVKNLILAQINSKLNT